MQYAIADAGLDGVIAGGGSLEAAPSAAGKTP